MDIAHAPLSDGLARMSVSGEVDMTTAPTLAASGDTALADPACSVLELDLSGVTFLDSSGIGALVAIRTSARAAAKMMRVVDPTPRVRQVIQVCGLSEEFGLAGLRSSS